MDAIELVSLAAGLMGTATGAAALIRFSASRKEAAIDKGRGQGLRDAAVSSLRATVDYHNDKIGELDDWKQESSKVIAKLTEGYDWIKATLGDLKEGVDELRRRT